MMTDDLSAPLGQQRKKPRRALPLTAFCVIVGGLMLVLGLWAVGGDDRFGAWQYPAKVTKTSDAAGSPEKTPVGSEVTQEPIAPVVPANTITIVDGQTGARREIVIPAPASGADLIPQ